MSDTQPHKARLLLARARPFLPLVAIALAALALWIAWGGWRHVQDGNRRAALEQARDLVSLSVAQALQAEQERLRERLESADVRGPLLRGEVEAAAAALARDWPMLEEAAVYPPALQSVYADLTRNGFGRAAVLEAAMSEDRALSLVIREDGSERLAVAAPIKDAGGALAGVAVARLPLARIRAGFDSAVIDEGRMYLALRQGSVTLLERGSAEHAGAAERLGTPVAGSGLRVAAGLPYCPASRATRSPARMARRRCSKPSPSPRATSNPPRNPRSRTCPNPKRPASIAASSAPTTSVAWSARPSMPGLPS